MKNNDWLLYIIFVSIGIFLGTIFYGEIPFLSGFINGDGNKKIVMLEKENKQLKVEVETHSKNTIVFKNELTEEKIKTKNLIFELKQKDSLFIKQQKEIDNTMSLINTQDSVLIKIYSNKYEEIGNITDMSLNERVLFFEKRFKAGTKR